MIESPLIQELMDKKAAETRRQDILRVLQTRFGHVPHELGTALQAIEDERTLGELVELAARCRTLNAFRKRLQP